MYAQYYNYYTSTTPTQVSAKNKPVNVFSNDGSFLDRFNRPKQDEEDKRKREETLKRKREFDNRFKNRGKRPALVNSSNESSLTSTPIDEGSPAPSVKRPRVKYHTTLEKPKESTADGSKKQHELTQSASEKSDIKHKNNSENDSADAKRK